MKLLSCIVLVFATICSATATSTASSSSSVSANANRDLETEVQPVQTSQLNNEYNRFRKSAGYGGGYGSASIPAPPCPKNYLFSCQPNLAPVPCAASYGSAGAYSVPVPSYVAPLGNTYGIPQTYPGIVPQPFNQLY